MAVARQTWEQFEIKAQMGLWRGIRSLQIKFHLKFWAPLDAIGGKVYFGRYVEYDPDEFDQQKG